LLHVACEPGLVETDPGRCAPTQAKSRTPCKFLAQGFCKYGASCHYLHEVSWRPQDSVGPRRSGGGQGTGNPNHADHSGGPDARKFRKQIAEQNSTMRGRWFLPATVPVSWEDCMNWMDQVAPKRCTEITFSDRTTADALHFFAKKFVSASKGNVGKYSDVLFTPNVVIARRSEQFRFELLPPHEQFGVSLVTAAAPNINFANEVKDLELMYNTVQSVLFAPLLHEPKTEALILGAWGCGAFGGVAEEIGELFARALRDGLGSDYKHIHFAIPRGDKNRNADVFRKCLKDYNIKFQEL